MVMSSHQISGMLAQQNQMFGGIASYAQQITPPMGMGPGMGMMSQSFMGPNLGMFNQGPAPVPPPMPVAAAWHPGMMGGMAMPFGPPSAGGAQAMGESFTGTMLAGASTAMQGLDTASSLAGLAGVGMGLAGIGGGAAATMGLLSAGPVGVGITGGVMASQQAYEGFQERARVNSVLRSRFGNVQGIGEGRGGRGFSTGEMGGISTMLREMGTEDITTNMEELTRIMDRTAGMGLYKGVQSAREFKQKFQQTVDGLKEMAEIMHTTLEGAAQFMQQQRGMGFFSGQDINRQLALTRTMSSVTGMSVGQVNEMAQQGAQFARMTGGRGRAGAQAAVLAGGKFAMAQRMGILSDEDVAFATGGLTGAEGAQAMGGRMMETSMRFMSRGAGRAMVAGLWDPRSGGISQERLQQAMSGELNIRDLLNQGRRSIRETGGRRSEFFRDEEQLRSQVLAQGGEYLPMAIYGTHLAEKRGLQLDDPIVQRMMRRKFRMGQGEVESAVKVMQNMPQIQAEMLVKGRQVREEEAAGAGSEFKGIQGLGKRLGQVWEREVQNKFRQFGDDISTDITRTIEGMVDTMEGRVSAKMSAAGRTLIAERSEFGRAVSDKAKGAEGFGQAEFNQFMQGMGRSAAFDRSRSGMRAVGMMLGMRPDEGMGRARYEQGFVRAGQLFSGEMMGLPSFLRGGKRGAQDIAAGLRGLSEDTGLGAMFDELTGYDPRRMTRRQRARALGYEEPDKIGTEEEQEQMQEFLRSAEAQMGKDFGLSRDQQDVMGKEYRDLMYGTLENTTVFNAWRKNYQKGFGGVKNVLAKMERWGSPELKAAAAKARKGSRAEQVAFVRMLEEEGDLQKDYRVTDELAKEMGVDISGFEQGMEGIRSRRARAMGDLEAATAAESRGAGQTALAKAARGIAGVAGGFLLSEGTGMGKKVEQAILGIGDTSSVSGKEMTDFLADSDVREAYVQWQTGGSDDERKSGLARLIGLKDSMSEGSRDTFARLKNISTGSSAKGKKALKDIAKSYNAEEFMAKIELQTDLGKSLASAMEGASLPSMSDEGRQAWEKLAEVTRLRSSKDPEKIEQSYELERELMDDIVGTQASKDLQKALQGREGGEYILAGLTGAEGYYTRFGGGKRGRRLGHRAKVANIMGAALGTVGMDLGDASILEAFGDKKGPATEREIVRMLSKGGEESERAISKILMTAKEGGMKDAQLSQLEQRLSGVGRALKDRKITDEEARKIAGGLGGRIAGAARAKGEVEKTATEDGQKVANKHLKSINAAISLMAHRDKVVKLDDDTVSALKKAIKTGATETRPA